MECGMAHEVGQDRGEAGTIAEHTSVAISAWSASQV
jgi:hypothetical protein